MIGLGLGAVIPEGDAVDDEPTPPDEVTGGAIGTTALEALDGVPSMPCSAAVTVTSYDTPAVSPLTVQLDVGCVVVQVSPPGLEVTVYASGVRPDDGAVQVTAADCRPAVAVGVHEGFGGSTNVSRLPDDVGEPPAASTFTLTD